jgi:diadenosine tetraphosphatase ApaH/serine/threonine PP2A family protein phosphatase
MPILIVSDVHANLVALEAVLEAAGTYDEIWNLGDIVGYGPRPRECIERVVELSPQYSLTGNHDWAAIGRLPLDEFNPAARFATYWTTAQLQSTHMEYLEGLPNRVIESWFMLVHGSPRHPVWEYVTSARVALPNFELFDSPVCFLGHTHVQMFISEDDARRGVAPHQPAEGDVLEIGATKLMVNPGSVGQPRDNDPRAAFALFDPQLGQVQFRRVEYDIAETQAQMETAGLPRPLITRLALGV